MTEVLIIHVTVASLLDHNNIDYLYMKQLVLRKLKLI